MSAAVNQIRISAVLVEKIELRRTPAGIAVFEAKFLHSGGVYEAGAMRKVEFEFTALAFADTAIKLDKVLAETEVEIIGFLARRSLRSSKLTVHITEFNIRS